MKPCHAAVLALVGVFDGESGNSERLREVKPASTRAPEKNRGPMPAETPCRERSSGLYDELESEGRYTEIQCLTI
jgi:hypothetical protein